MKSPEEEDHRRLCRERKTLTNERVCHVNRIKGLLFSQGVTDYEPLRKDRRQRLEELRTGDGRALPPHIKAQICRELDRVELLLEQIKTVEDERDAAVSAQIAETQASPAKMLLEIKGIGAEFAAVLASECLYRKFDNRRQVAAYAGLAPTPWQSGSVDREQCGRYISAIAACDCDPPFPSILRAARGVHCETWQPIGQAVVAALCRWSDLFCSTAVDGCGIS